MHHFFFVKAGTAGLHWKAKLLEAGEPNKARKRVPNLERVVFGMACSRLLWLAATICGLLAQGATAQDTWCGKVYNG